MINTIKIENFQSHKDSTLKLSKGVNVIKGQSDSGKTAVLRALRWLILNRPNGFFFKSTFAKDKDHTHVDVDFIDSAHTASRDRNSKENRYILDRQGKDGEFDHDEFEALRGEVPSEVLSVLNLDERNIHTQFDPHFMLNDAAGEVAKKLNKVTGLDVIDKLLSSINSIVSTTTREIRGVLEQIENNKTQLYKYKFVDVVEPRVNNCEILVDRLSKDDQRFSELEVILKHIKMEREIFEANKSWLEVEEPFNKVMATLETINATQKKAADISELKRQIGWANDTIVELTQFVSDLEPPMKELLSLSQNVEELKTKYVNLNGIVNKVISENNNILICEEALQHTKAMENCYDLENRVNGQRNKMEGLQSLMKNIEDTNYKVKLLALQIREKQKVFNDKFPDRCPLCNQTVRKEIFE